MLPNRYTIGQSSVVRKSRLEGKPSLLPKPRRPGSTDRLSTEARRPSTNTHRSSSAEPARGTLGVRLSREASATKLPLNGRSRSQTGESRYGQATTTPLRSSHYSRPTTTPVRTPSDDLTSRNWLTSLERALAFVTIKDQRPLASAAWQRAESARVAEALAARGSAALLRPLTIARFVDVAGALLAAVARDIKLSTDNYVTKLPHLAKRLLYPGTVSKSWLRTVNTLHAFPHALALISYLLDLVSHIEMPVLDEWLYVAKDDLACLRRNYLYQCWIRFQEPGHQFEDLNEDYLLNFNLLLGYDEEKITELQQVVKKYEACLEDEAEAEAAALADEARRSAKRDALVAALRAERGARRGRHSALEEARAAGLQRAAATRALDLELERAGAQLERLRAELAAQALSVEERARLLDGVDYAARVHDSKRALAERIAKMVMSKETEVALWQKKTLDCCLEYKQGLIHLSTQLPELASLAVDENELMGAQCAGHLAGALDVLREQAARLQAERTDSARARSAHARHRAALREESCTKIAELKSSIQREQQSLDTEMAKETSEAAAWVAEEREVADKLEKLKARQEEYSRVESELEFWEKQDSAWRTKLLEMANYIESQKLKSKRILESAREKRVRLVLDNLALLNEKLGC